LTESEQQFNLQIFSNVGHGFAVSLVDTVVIRI
jgi:hypothetical protein